MCINIHTYINTGDAEERRGAVSEPASASESHWPPAGDSSVDGGETGGEVHGFVDAVMNSCVHIIFSCVDGVIYVCACVRACACVPVGCVCVCVCVHICINAYTHTNTHTQQEQRQRLHNAPWSPWRNCGREPPRKTVTKSVTKVAAHRRQPVPAISHQRVRARSLSLSLSVFRTRALSLSLPVSLTLPLSP